MPTTGIYEGFSLSHAAILDTTTGLDHVDGDIYGVEEASLDPDTDSYENHGDDAVLSTWDWLNFAKVTVKAGYIPFKLVQLLSGESITSSGASPNEYWSVNLWTDRSMNVQPRPMLIRIPSKDSAGLVRVHDFVLYKVQFSPIKFDGPTFKDGLKVNYEGKALLSTTDEKGAVLSGGFKAVGRMINHP